MRYTDGIARSVRLGSWAQVLFGVALGLTLLAPNAAHAGVSFSLSNGATFLRFASSKKTFSLGGKALGADDMVARYGYNLNLRIGYDFRVVWRFHIAADVYADYTTAKIVGAWNDAGRAAGLSPRAHSLVSLIGPRFSVEALSWLWPWFSVGVGYGFVGIKGENAKFSAEKFGGGFGWGLGLGVDFRLYKILYLGPAFRFHQYFYKAKPDGLFGTATYYSLSAQLMVQL
ncbi:MAG: hypothetical protein KC609_15760 [Myxococcales bacterium]|nr:hypothetical protein [Myxococcales bacterium]